MLRARLVPASLIHVNPLARHLREIDRRECEAFGRSPKQALRISLKTSLHAVAALHPHENRPLAMFGVSPIDMLSGRGSPWFLGTDEVFEYGRDLVSRGPRIIAWFQAAFGEMENFVSVENVKAIRLLKAWGAEVEDRTQTIGGVAFMPFRFSAAIQGETSPG